MVDVKFYKAISYGYGQKYILIWDGSPSVEGICVHQENVSREHILLGNSVLLDMIYCPPLDKLSEHLFNYSYLQ